jgi:hypothetical protein
LSITANTVGRQLPGLMKVSRSAVGGAGVGSKYQEESGGRHLCIAAWVDFVASVQRKSEKIAGRAAVPAGDKFPSFAVCGE